MFRESAHIQVTDHSELQTVRQTLAHFNSSTTDTAESVRKLTGKGRPMIGIRLDPILHRGLHALAQVRGRSLSVLIREILVEHSRGVLNTPERVLNTLGHIGALIKVLEVQLFAVNIAGIDTPGELAGIRVKGKNKWMTLIHNASRKRTD